MEHKRSTHPSSLSLHHEIQNEPVPANLDRRSTPRAIDDPSSPRYCPPSSNISRLPYFPTDAPRSSQSEIPHLAYSSPYGPRAARRTHLVTNPVTPYYSLFPREEQQLPTDRSSSPSRSRNYSYVTATDGSVLTPARYSGRWQASENPTIGSKASKNEYLAESSTLSSLARRFVCLGLRSHKDLSVFISTSPSILTKNEIDSLRAEASAAEKAGDSNRAHTYICQALILWKCKEVGPSNVNSFLRDLTTAGRVNDAFVRDVKFAYNTIREQSRKVKQDEGDHVNFVVHPNDDPFCERQSSDRLITSRPVLIQETGEADFQPKTQEQIARQNRIIIQDVPSRARRDLGNRPGLPRQQAKQEVLASGVDPKDPFTSLSDSDDQDPEGPKKLVPNPTFSFCSLTAASAQEPKSNTLSSSSERLEENGGAESDVTDLRKNYMRLQKDMKINEENASRSRVQLNQKEQTFTGMQDHDGDEIQLEVNSSQYEVDQAGGLTWYLGAYLKHQLQRRSEIFEHKTSRLTRTQADDCGKADTVPNLAEVEEETRECLGSTDSSPPTSEGEASFIASAGSNEDVGASDDDLARLLEDMQSTIVSRSVRKYAREHGVSVCSPGSDSMAPTGAHADLQPHRVSSRADPHGSERRSKRARSYRDDGGGDGEDEDEDQKRNGHQQPHNSGSKDSSHELFACPYSKYDPFRYSGHNLAEKTYRGCSSSFLRDIPRVKQHLYRVHKRPNHYCGSCFQVFEIQEALDTHTRQRPSCENSDVLFSEKMTVDQFNSVKRRRYGKDAPETWFNIYAILFPDSPLPASPFCEAASSTAVLSFSQRFRNEAPPMLSELVRNRIQDSIPLEQFEQQILDNALEEALSEVILQFGPDFEAAELSTNSPLATHQILDSASLATSTDPQSTSHYCLSTEVAKPRKTATMNSTGSSAIQFKTPRSLFANHESLEQVDYPGVSFLPSPFPETIPQGLHGPNAHSSACFGNGTNMNTGTRCRRMPASSASARAISQNPPLQTMAQNAYDANANTWLWSSSTSHPDTAPQAQLSETAADQSADFDFSTENFDLDLFGTFDDSEALAGQPLPAGSIAAEDD